MLGVADAAAVLEAVGRTAYCYQVADELGWDRSRARRVLEAAAAHGLLEVEETHAGACRRYRAPAEDDG